MAAILSKVRVLNQPLVESLAFPAQTGSSWPRRASHGDTEVIWAGGGVCEAVMNMHMSEELGFMGWQILTKLANRFFKTLK